MTSASLVQLDQEQLKPLALLLGERAKGNGRDALNLNRLELAHNRPESRVKRRQNLVKSV